jgi:hypothetical protein
MPVKIRDDMANLPINQMIFVTSGKNNESYSLLKIAKVPEKHTIKNSMLN